MKRRILFLLCVCFSLLAAAQKNEASWYSIKAFLPGWNGSVVSLSVRGKELQVDTVRKELCSLNGQVQEPEGALLTVTKGSLVLHQLPFILERGTYRVLLNRFGVLSLSGTPSNDQYNSLVKRFDSLTRVSSGKSGSNSFVFRHNLAKNFIRSQPSSPVSLHLLRYYSFFDRSDTAYPNLFDELDSTLRHSYTGRIMEEEMRKRFATALGRPAPNLPQRDTAGRTVPLYEKGKYTLIDFWASWCVPCRRENPDLVRVYRKFEAQPFSIVSVSLDNSRVQWIRAIHQDSLPWTHRSELNGWNGLAIQAYGIHSIPSNILLDPNGKILAKNLKPAELERYLKRLFP